MSTPDPLLMNAVQAFRAGDVVGAEAACRALLDINPRHGQARHIQALIAAHSNRLDDALTLLDLAIEADPTDPSFPNTLGSLLFQTHRYAEAEPAFRRAAAINGRLPEVHGNLGNTLKALGRLDEAVESYRRALDLRPNAPEMHHFLGTTLRALGCLDEAEASLRAALTHAPEYLEARHALAEVLDTLGRPDEAEAFYRQVLKDAPRFVPAHVGLSHALLAQDRAGDAVAAIDTAHGLAPDHPVVRAARRRVYAAAVPAVPVPCDGDCAAAFRAALEQAVTPESLVLEIGTGSGLLALMAAKAGARRVVACESNPALAAVAAETVARNGFQDRITVVAKPSTRLSVGPDGDLPEKADVLVADLTGPGLLTPRMLAVLQHARTHLLKPEGVLIPRAATVFGMLVETPALVPPPSATVEGFDLSALEVFRAHETLSADLAAEPHTPLSESFEALSFDFTRTLPDEAERRLSVTATAGGTCHGVAFWFDLDMDGTAVYHAGPGSTPGRRKQAVALFAAPLTVQPGDTITLMAHYDSNRISFRRL